MCRSQPELPLRILLDTNASSSALTLSRFYILANIFIITYLHSSIQGIGIDDMFVIMQSLSNVKRSPVTSSLPPDQQIAEALKHAGVAVTVTSVTDVFAFACGAVTVSLMSSLGLSAGLGKNRTLRNLDFCRCLLSPIG